MKKMISIVLSFLGLCGLVACSGGNDVDNSMTVSNSSTFMESSSYNESYYSSHYSQFSANLQSSWQSEYNSSSIHAESSISADISDDCEHDYTQEYICRLCQTPKDCSLEILGEDFSKELLNQAYLMAGDMTGNYEVVVLGKEETLANIENYTFDNRLDKTKIIAGLFVKFDVIMDGENVAFTIYYNFGLQFSEEQNEDIGVTYDGSEIWYLEVVDGNKTILFEYSIT